MEEKGIKFEAAPRKNMNRLMSRFECYHIKHRSIIESDWGTLKNNFQLEYHKARSIVGMFRHFFYSIAAYMINRNLDFLQNQLITYIGNKRALLPFIGQAVQIVQKNLNKEKLDCLDIFGKKKNLKYITWILHQ